MTKRWTIKEFENIPDRDFIVAILNEKRNELTNVYSPLSQKISQVIARLYR